NRNYRLGSIFPHFLIEGPGLSMLHVCTHADTIWLVSDFRNCFPFERKGFKLVAVKIVIPSKDFAEKHYHDLKERPFFNGLCDFLSSGPVVAMVWEGEGVIKYGRKLIGATDPQKSEPGTIRGDLAVVVGRNIIHGSDGPETAKDEINLWFKPEELVSYTSNAEKWVYGVN
ncbi:UNVERIFIED_CONTAM: Nucleoside diphosphate kinase, chloroplastic, partial [Sesamum radiatum]